LLPERAIFRRSCLALSSQINDAEEAMVLDKIRWWKLSELHDALERLTPLSLVNIVESDLREGAPIELPDAEVLIG
jgi:hypothetical protein